MRTTPASLLLVLFIASAAFAADGPRVEPGDVPRHTQMGEPPAPAGAPGRGRYFPPVPADPDLPTLWIIGDSTVRNGTLGDGSNWEQWGWGAPIVAYFDSDRINVVNRAFGGTSSRSFYSGFFWRDLKPRIRPGDFVLIQFGANDNGDRGALPGTGSERRDDGRETVRSFGWYLTQFVEETRERGATPILCSLTPREGWTEDGKFRRAKDSHVAWTAAVAEKKEVPYIDLYELIALKYEEMGPEAVVPLYVPAPDEHLHTGWDGAVINAGRVIAGLRGLEENPLAPYLSERAEVIEPARPD